MARYRLADLCLDTYPYNGHTTTSDAVYAGRRVVTTKGTSFASRVASSVLWHQNTNYQAVGSLKDLKSQIMAQLNAAHTKDIGSVVSPFPQEKTFSDVILSIYG